MAQHPDIKAFDKQVQHLLPAEAGTVAELDSERRGAAGFLGRIAAKASDLWGKANAYATLGAFSAAEKVQNAAYEENGKLKGSAKGVLALGGALAGTVVAARVVGAVDDTLENTLGQGADLSASHGANHDTVGQAVREVVAHKHSTGGQTFDIQQASFGQPADPNAVPTPAGGVQAPALQLDDFEKGEGWNHYLKGAGMSDAEIKDLLHSEGALKGNLVQTLVAQGDAKVSGNGIRITHAGKIHAGSIDALQHAHQEWVAKNPAVAPIEVAFANGQGRVSLELPTGYDFKLDAATKTLHINTPQGADIPVQLPDNAIDANGQLSAEAQKAIKEAVEKAGLEVAVENRSQKVDLLDGKLVEHAKPGETGVLPIEYNTGPNSKKLLIQHTSNGVMIDTTKMTKDGSFALDTNGNRVAMNTLPTHVALTDADGKTIFVELDKDGKLFVAPDSPLGKLLADGRHITVRAGLYDPAEGKFHSFATAVPGAKGVHLGEDFKLVGGAKDATTLAGQDTKIVVKTTGATPSTPVTPPAEPPKPGPTPSTTPTTPTPQTTSTTPSPTSTTTTPVPTTSTTPPATTTTPVPTSVNPTTTTEVPSTTNVLPTTTEAPAPTTSSSRPAAGPFVTGTGNQETGGGDLLVPTAWVLGGGLAVGGAVAGVKAINRKRANNRAQAREQRLEDDRLHNEAFNRGRDILLKIQNSPMSTLAPDNGKRYDASNTADVENAKRLAQGFIGAVGYKAGHGDKNFDPDQAKATLAPLNLLAENELPDVNDPFQMTDFANHLRAYYGDLPAYSQFLGNSDVQLNLLNVKRAIAGMDDSELVTWAAEEPNGRLLTGLMADLVPAEITDRDQVGIARARLESMGIPGNTAWYVKEADEQWRLTLWSAGVARKLSELAELVPGATPPPPPTPSA